MQALIGIKQDQSQKFLENGKRIPVTFVDANDNQVISIKTNEKDQYLAVQLGFGTKKKASKAEIGHAKGAKRNSAPKFLKEVRINEDSEVPQVGSILNPTEVFQPGDIVNVTGTSKGKGFAGVVKRHGFHGGPKTHGQSDRHRAPGSIGMGTTPGRVFKGKKMAGRMGHETVTVTNLQVVEVGEDGVLVIKGLVPGIKKEVLFIKKTGEDKKFVPLYVEKKDDEKDTESNEEKETTKESVSSNETKSPANTDSKPKNSNKTEAMSGKKSTDDKKEVIDEDKKESTEKKNRKSSEARSSSAREVQENASK